MDPLAEILEAAGIPQDRPTRTVAARDGHSVVTSDPLANAFRRVEPQSWWWTGEPQPDDFFAAFREGVKLQLEQWEREFLNGWA